MPTIAFWNLNHNVSAECVVAFARERDVDILVLAENPFAPYELARALNTNAKRLYFADVGLSERVSLFTRFFAGPSCLIRDSHGVAIRHYETPLGSSILVVAMHLSSKLRKSNDDQILASTRAAKYIRDAESQVKHSRTVVIGDLNMNPFEVGVVGSEGFHAVMDRRIAAKRSRIVQGVECQFFYNPMWSTFGDSDSSPSGTYFYDSGSEVNYYWNVFDQILIRPALLNFVEPNSIQVITEVQNMSLLTKSGRPNRNGISDHLPVVCRLNDILE